MTDACENIAFPHTCVRSVNINFWVLPSNVLCRWECRGSVYSHFSFSGGGGGYSAQVKPEVPTSLIIFILGRRAFLEPRIWCSVQFEHKFIPLELATALQIVSHIRMWRLNSHWYNVNVPSTFELCHFGDGSICLNFMYQCVWSIQLSFFHKR